MSLLQFLTLATLPYSIFNDTKYTYNKHKETKVSNIENYFNRLKH